MTKSLSVILSFHDMENLEEPQEHDHVAAENILTTAGIIEDNLYQEYSSS